MNTTPRKSKKDKEPSGRDELSFEAALDRLEKIVGDLELGESDLSAALAGYEEGVKLLVKCQAALDEAERIVTTIGADASATVATPTAPTFTAEPSPQPPPPSPTPARGAPITPPFDADEDDDPPF